MLRLVRREGPPARDARRTVPGMEKKRKDHFLMQKDIPALTLPRTKGWYAVGWLRPEVEDRLTAWKSGPEKEAQALVKRAIRRDPEPQYRMVDLTAREEERLGELGVPFGFIPNGPSTEIYWYKHGTVIRYSECLI
jgi:hypothetical protein